ncbi:DNA methyltransferase [uncultured Treponema sp.]|uniref:DNA methyltransferase n=1 Tax=uncultured Treponema sp. TaxID=162155 RepID=UPI0025F3721D|nr:DNA methyltransferase [uncultured Treponema sp.]
MTQNEMQAAAKKFAAQWLGKGDEKQETQRFWIELLGEVLGIRNPASYIEFEKRVKLSHTNYIDAYIPETKVLIEQKGIKIDLKKAYEQSDGTLLTPYEQAKRYVNDMKASEKPRWIVVCNFAEFNVYDMENPQNPPEVIFLKDLEKDFYRLEFLINRKNENIRREEEISLAAGKLVGKMYDALIKEFIPQGENGELTADQARSLNILCVRLVFCFYTEDAGLFAIRTAFEDYLRSFNLQNVRLALINLFKALDTKIEERDKYDTSLNPFPYVNGGLFKDEKIEIPNFTQEIVDVLCNDCAAFNWSEISPTIFGAVFESTLNPETRRKGGMHYTSIENIHKVIDPLFMDSLNREFEEICGNKTLSKSQKEKLFAFQKKLGSLTFLDPACGSGNFLTETFLSLRRLENKIISLLNKGERVFGFDEFIHVKISQFFGIEINDFAVTVAKTALWIAESQMINETEKIMGQTIDFLPLTTNAFIVEGNALRMDWATLKPADGGEQPADGLFAGITTHVDGSAHYYDYIMGNPPFVGARMMAQGSGQKKEIEEIFGGIKDVQDLDYVTGWYKKAALLIQRTNTEAAFVSTNSICQGSQVPILWNVLLNNLHVKINFAYQTFKWKSESSDMAAVHCVIVGFSCFDRQQKLIFESDGKRVQAKNISPYLFEGGNSFVEARKETLCDVPKMNFGNQPRDGGNFVISEEEHAEILKKEPALEKYLHPYIGAEEFINNKKRWCLWLKGASPAELRKSRILSEKVSAVREFRLSSKAKTTNGYAKVPEQFAQITQPEGADFLIVPRVSSERRFYVPVGFLKSGNISSDAVQIVPYATLFHFGVITSNVHMAWMRAVCGRLKSDYRYSKELVYNTFPFVTPECQAAKPVEATAGHFGKFNARTASKEKPETPSGVPNPCDVLPHCTQAQADKIEKTAKQILDTREKYPDCSLADLYDETFMPADLRKAHKENDHAVLQAYGFPLNLSESEIVARLFGMYEKLTQNR